MDVSSLLFGHSKALYSTWVFYKPDHLLIDCGEGAATSLGNGGFAIERVLLTHGHIDHISGLPSLLWSRAAGMGDTDKPLDVYYPRDDVFVGDMQSYLERTATRLPFALRWIPLDAGASFALTPNYTADKENEQTSAGHRLDSLKRGMRRVVTFPTRHIRGRLTLGYKVVEPRRRLKPEFATLTQQEIRARAMSGGAEEVQALTEEYEAALAVFGGDGLPLDPAQVSGAELLLHEATIVDATERKHQWHSTLDEAIQVAAAVRPKALVLYHISGRYQMSDVVHATGRLAPRHQIEFPIWCLYRDRLAEVWNGASQAAATRPRRAPGAQQSQVKTGSHAGPRAGHKE